jgi:hypothetical protein
MARTGMSDLVQTVRELSNAGTGEFTVGTVSYFSDDHIQASLDNHRKDFQFEPMQTIPEQVAGSVVYKEFHIYDNTEAGTLFYLQYASGTVVGTSLYSVDNVRGVVTFTNDTVGTAFYATGRTYDPNMAASEIWKRKASNVANQVDWSSDNHSIKNSQVFQFYTKQASYFASLGKQNTVSMFRGDMSGIH